MSCKECAPYYKTNDCPICAPDPVKCPACDGAGVFYFLSIQPDYEVREVKRNDPEYINAHPDDKFEEKCLDCFNGYI